jgi:hypothetical protein
VWTVEKNREKREVPIIGFEYRRVWSSLLVAYTLQIAKAWIPYFQ